MRGEIYRSCTVWEFDTPCWFDAVIETDCKASISEPVETVPWTEIGTEMLNKPPYCCEAAF